MRTITVPELRANIDNLLDEVLATGIPIEIIKDGQTLQIVAVEKVNKLDHLIRRPEIIQGDPDELVDHHLHARWS